MGLRARTRAGFLTLPGAGTIMARALAGGLPVASSCSGRGACGRCLVAILEGGSCLSDMEPHELEVLTRNGAAAGTRLACQTRLTPADADVLITTGYW
ncbi:MAG TPA: 2Fe-2S iron-sulfur cluster-binding protein [Holophagaceae bacterium]|nr:2Fe-2S iron-sulfur cluster-binding protein [Holophagaceae bacterium]